MSQEFIHKKALVAPLDWGLGHATRCIPLIRYLYERQFDVVIACSGEQEILLRTEFPQLAFVERKGYKVRYARSKRLLPLVVLLQLPKILCAIYDEHRWLRKLQRQHQFDLVISDNRYGLSVPGVATIFITHQLLVQAPYSWLERLMQSINYRFINRFTQCWVPDYPGPLNIAGRLSHPEKMPAIPVHYIGPLSRFSGTTAQTDGMNYLFLVSGPEPQRSMLEAKVTAAAGALRGSCVIVRGKPGDKAPGSTAGNVTVYNHLESDALQALVQAADWVVCRPGYTSVMELLQLRKKAVLIPTPGQTEQEYLGRRLMQQRWCFTCSQEDDLGHQLKAAAGFTFEFPQFATTDLFALLDKLIAAALKHPQG